MSNEDLQQIRQVVREELAEAISASESRMIERQYAMAAAFTANLGELRTELLRRFDSLEMRLQTVERSMDALERRIDSLNLTVSRSEADRRAVNDLAARVTKLEQGRAQ